MLKRLLDLDPGYCGTRVDCGGGHQATFCGYREKIVDTVLGPIHLRRAHYHCPECHRGPCPKDQNLGVANSSLSPRLRRMFGQPGQPGAVCPRTAGFGRAGRPAARR